MKEAGFHSEEFYNLVEKTQTKNTGHGYPKNYTVKKQVSYLGIECST